MTLIDSHYNVFVPSGCVKVSYGGAQSLRYKVVQRITYFAILFCVLMYYFHQRFQIRYVCIMTIILTYHLVFDDEIKCFERYCALWYCVSVFLFVASLFIDVLKKW